MGENYQQFQDLTFEDFQRMAIDTELSKYEKIGFPNAYREGKEEAIFADIRRKLTALDQRGKVVLDIGPGCSELPHMLLAHCQANDHHLVLVDSPEMLAQLPGAPNVEKVAGRYPAVPELLERQQGKVDVLLCYSVFHYIYTEGNIWDFLDASLQLLAEGGQMLLGDIPNFSKRKRFFSSSAGVRHHQAFTGTNETPEVVFNRVERGSIDDAVVLALLARARNQGFDAYVVPQLPELPMANRREDILITNP